MSKLCYIPKEFNEAHLRIIAKANQVLEERAQGGFATTLRGLYYQFVAADFFPNRKESYDLLGRVVSDARLAGLIDWTAIRDNLRQLEGVRHWVDAGAAMVEARKRYATDLWATQRCRPEVWIEKDAMVPVIEGICTELRVDFFACRGYASQSSMWEAGQRLAGYVQRGQRPVVLYFGDHDPSGVDMTRDIRERLTLFVGVDVLVVRLGLNMEQVERYNPPPNYAKPTDARYRAYVDEYGTEDCWELDALHPAVIRYLIETEVARYRDEAVWEAAVAQENDDKDTLDLAIEQMGFIRKQED